jgi:hypothetical protein
MLFQSASHRRLEGKSKDGHFRTRDIVNFAAGTEAGEPNGDSFLIEKLHTLRSLDTPGVERYVCGHHIERNYSQSSPAILLYTESNGRRKPVGDHVLKWCIGNLGLRDC